MGTEHVHLTVTDDRDRHGNGPEPYAKCPIHGNRIYTSSGVVNKISCDICGKTLGYGGCCASDNAIVCGICSRMVCHSCSTTVTTGHHQGTIVCRKCR